MTNPSLRPSFVKSTMVFAVKSPLICAFPRKVIVSAFKKAGSGLSFLDLYVFVFEPPQKLSFSTYITV